MKNPSTKIISHGAIYLLGNILRRTVSFIMLPIYTRYLTTADYGTIELISMAIDLVSIILGLRIGEAVFKFYSDYEDPQDKKHVISTSIWLVLVLNAFGVSIIAIFSKPLSVFIFGSGSVASYLALFSLTLVFQALVEIPMLFIRAQQRAWVFVIFSTSQLVLQLSLNIFFVVMKQMHVAGVIYSAVISVGTMAIALGIYTLPKTGVHFSLSKAKELVSFSIPMILTSIMTFYMTFGDRYFIRKYWGLDEVGIYSLGYKFGFLLGFIAVGPFFNIWDSEKYNIYKREEATEVYQKVFLSFSSFLLFVAIGISLFSKDVIRVMAHTSFWPAYKIVPIVLAAYVCQAWAGYANLGILVKKKTMQITYGALIGTGIITIGYIFLIPAWGGIGAAWATLFAFAGRLLWVHWRSERLYSMELPWGKVGLLVAFVTLMVAISFSVPDRLIISVAVNILLIISFILGILFLPILPENQRRWMLQFLRKPTEMKYGLSSLMGK